jgi:hypothetical protein
MDNPSVSKLICFEETKECRQENMSVSGSGKCEGSVYIFGPFLVTFLDKQKSSI